MQELKSILSEFADGWNRLPNYSKRVASIVGAQTMLCVLSLLYCIVGMYHQYYKGLICLVAQVAITSMTYVTLTKSVNPVGILLVNCIVLFAFVHVNTRKWAYLSNDHDIINDYSY